jgi:hypothetical protein
MDSIPSVLVATTQAAGGIAGQFIGPEIYGGGADWMSILASHGAGFVVGVLVNWMAWKNKRDGEGEKGGERRKGDGREEAGKSKQRENEETMEEVVISPPDGPARKKPSSQFSGGASGAVGLTRTPITENASSTTISKVLLGGDDKARQGLPKSFLPPQSELYRPQGAESSVWAVCRKHEKYPNAALCLQCGKWLSHMTSTTSNLKNHIDSCKGTYSSYPDCRPINRGASAGASARSIKDSFQSAVDVAPQSRQKRREEKLVRW